MKNNWKILSLLTALVVTFSACDKTKVDSLPFHANGKSPIVLTTSSSTVAPVPVDSNNVAVTFSWSDPMYATDTTNYKFIIELDTSASADFIHPISTTTQLTSLSKSFVAKDLNSLLLNSGMVIGHTYDLFVRVTSSYENNNEQYRSNVLDIKVTPYLVPPKVVPPTSGHLYLVGDASQGGWNNPVPVPTQEFSKIDDVTYGGVFNIVGGKQYLALPVNGDWTHKFSVADNTISGLAAGGDFGYDLSQNFPGPATSGWYRIILNFQSGKFTVTPFTSTMPSNLFIVGDATNGGWSNPVPVPSQQLTQLNSSEFTVTLPLTGGKQYLLLPVNGDWSHKYSVADNTLAGLAAGGEFGYDLPQNFPGPATSGNYTVSVNFALAGTDPAHSMFKVK
jgi:starch-binding outer membrane protein SusE/F